MGIIGYPSQWQGVFRVCVCDSLKGLCLPESKFSVTFCCFYSVPSCGGDGQQPPQMFILPLLGHGIFRGHRGAPKKMCMKENIPQPWGSVGPRDTDLTNVMRMEERNAALGSGP